MLEKGTVTSEVLTAFERLMNNKDDVESLNAWLIDNEPTMTEWARRFAGGLVGEWELNYQIPRPVTQQIETMVSRSINMGYMVGMLANNALYDAEIDTSIVKNIAMSNPTVYSKWLSGEMDPKYYDKDQVNIDIGDLGSDWDTAVANFEEKQAKRRKEDAKKEMFKKTENGSNKLTM